MSKKMSGAVKRKKLNILRMKKDFNLRMASFNQRLKKWSDYFGVPQFTFKTRDKYDEKLETMPEEKYFNYLMDIHVVHTCHGNVGTMLAAIKEEGVWIPYEAVYVFTKICSECSILQKQAVVKKERRQTGQLGINHGELEIINMQKNPDGEYRYILHYKDLHTRFTWLRPLKSPSIDEIAINLLEIFMTVGNPDFIRSYGGQKFNEDIIKRLNSLIPFAKIVGVYPYLTPSRQIKELVKRRLTKNNLKDRWSLGIYYVEFDLNKIKKSRVHLSAFERMFGRKPGTGLFKRFYSPRPIKIFKKLENEEDLQKLPSVNKYVGWSGEEIQKTQLLDYENNCKAWCFICGNKSADTECDDCGVSMHSFCKPEIASLCDCCKKYYVTGMKSDDDESDNVNIYDTLLPSEIPSHSFPKTSSNAPKTYKRASTSANPKTDSELKDTLVSQYGKRKIFDHNYATPSQNDIIRPVVESDGIKSIIDDSMDIEVTDDIDEQSVTDVKVETSDEIVEINDTISINDNTVGIRDDTIEVEDTVEICHIDVETRDDRIEMSHFDIETKDDMFAARDPLETDDMTKL